MNENTFVSQRTHTRVKFEPLATSCHLRCLTPDSPAAQTMQLVGSELQPVPNRALSPCLIFPDVRATDPDNIFHHGSANEYLSLDVLQWYVDGEPIADVWTVNTDYVIDTTATDTRGTLHVLKNLDAEESAVLSFKGQFHDWRTGINYAVESDELALTCVNKGEDAITCSVDKKCIEYDPLYDGLLLWEHKQAKGITVTGTRASHIDGKSYEQEINVVLTIGTQAQSVLPTGVAMRVVELGQVTALVPNSEATPQLLLATYPTLKFDMRMIDREEYEVQFVENNAIIARESFSLHTKTTMPTFGTVLRGADISPSQLAYENTVLLNLADRLVEYPELYYMLTWYTQAQVLSGSTYIDGDVKRWQYGERMEADIEDLGIGMTKNDSFFNLWFEAEAHATRELLTDEDGDVLVDENGDFLID